MLILVSPGSTIHRLELLNASDTDIVQEGDLGTIGSQISREALLRLSINYSLAHPVVGVGPGQFSDTVLSDYKKRGIHVQELSTHNGYTQISSECGIPAAGIFIAMIWLTIRNNHRIYRKMRTTKHEMLSRMAFAVMLSAVGLAANLMFHHIGYTMYLSTLTGLSIALELAARSLPFSDS